LRNNCFDFFFNMVVCFPIGYRRLGAFQAEYFLPDTQGGQSCLGEIYSYFFTLAGENFMNKMIYRACSQSIPKLYGIVACALYFLILTVADCRAAANPAATYCEVMGYDYSITRDRDGNATDVCTFPDHSSADAWGFFRGQEAQQFSFCEQNGFSMETDRVHTLGFVRDIPVCVARSRNSSGQRIPMLELLEAENLMKPAALRPMRTPPATSTETPVFDEQKTKTALPQALDWRDVNGRSYIGAVRNQGSCGSCYAFGAAAAAEGTYNYATNRYDSQAVDFSESFIAWCLGTYGPYVDHFGGCDGANYEYAELTALTREGIILESLFPYTGTDPGGCSYWNTPRIRFQSWGRIAPNNTTAIQQALATYGVLDVAVMTSSAFDTYSGGIFTDSLRCENGAYSKTNHAVALVGWGTDPTHGVYWILRNSWGKNWGEDGYMRIQAHSAKVDCAATYLQFGNIPDPELEPVNTVPANFLLLRPAVR
jgi:C1A family cysteine protease/putative hemolysin